MRNTNIAGHIALLPALDALLDLASVTRAGERIGLSQPAMSRVLARLRNQFGDPLLVREGAHWRLTPRAEALRPPVREVLAAATALHSAEIFDPRTARRTFRVAIPDVIAAIVLASIHAALRRAAPDCELVLVPWPRREDDLTAIDLAIGSEPGIFPHFRMTPLYDDIDIVAYRAADGAPLPDTLLTRPHVAVVPVGFASDLVDDWLGAQGRSRPVALVVPHYLQALHIVAQTDLLAILPSRLVAAHGRALGVGATESGVPQQPDRNWLFHPARLDADPANRWLRDLVRRTCIEALAQ